MVDTKMSCNTESFQSINNLFIKSLDEVKAVKSLPQSSIVNDVYLLSFLARKMCQLVDHEKIQSLHAIFCGINLNFFVIKGEFGEVIALLDVEHELQGNKITSIETAFYLNRKRFLADRYDKVFVRGKRLIMDGMPEIREIEKVFEKDIALLIQHEMDHQQGLFLHETSVEVETF